MRVLGFGAVCALMTLVPGAGCGSRSGLAGRSSGALQVPASLQAPLPRGSAVGGWAEVAPGVEMRRFSWADGGRTSPVVALRVAPARLRVAVGAGGASLGASAWRAREKALAAFNGGFFDAQGRSLGVRLSEGRLLSKPHGTRWKVLRVKKIAGSGRGEAKIISAEEFSDGLRRGVRYQAAVQCGPLLAEGGRLGSLKEQWDRRTGLGIDGAGRVVVAASDESLSLRGWALCFVRGLGCPDALNLDGGSSTQVSLRVGRHSLEWGGGRDVPDAILVR